MRLKQLTAEIQSWRVDESALIKSPLSQRVVSRAEAFTVINQISKILNSNRSMSDRALTLGLCFDDPATWILSILSALVGNFIYVPIPKEFSRSQIASFTPHLDFILTDSEAASNRFDDIFATKSQTTSHDLNDDLKLFLLKLNHENRQDSLSLPTNAVAVIHTSGSTNSPKGVVISELGLSEVIQSMLERTSRLGQINYTSILPYSLLLEQILGIFLPILTRGSIAILPRTVDCYIGTQTNLDLYLQTIKLSEGNFTMLPPSFLTQLQKSAQHIQNIPPELSGLPKVIATGGAPIDISCLEFYKNNQIDIYQGYGLSENTSVVAWNFPGPNILGSVGLPLAHNKVRINVSSQIEVSGKSLFLGYVNDGGFLPRKDEWLNTGDLGYFGEDGRLYVTGRDTNLLVLSSGRNVAPEWIENRYRQILGVRDLIIVGHGKPFLAAIILVDKEYDSESVLKRVNDQSNIIAGELPVFAKVSTFRAVPFDEKFYSVSSRILRTKVLEKYEDLINNIYEHEEPRGVPECKTMSL